MAEILMQHPRTLEAAPGGRYRRGGYGGGQGGGFQEATPCDPYLAQAVEAPASLARRRVQEGRVV